MSDLPRVSIASQITAVERASGRLDGTSSPPTTPGQIALEQRDLSAAANSLRWLADNRDAIVEAVRAQREAGQ